MFQNNDFGQHVATYDPQALLATAEARLAGVPTGSGWFLRLAYALRNSFISRLARNATITVSATWKFDSQCSAYGTHLKLQEVLSQRWRERRADLI